MIVLEEKIVEKIISNCILELNEVDKITFKTVSDVTEKIPIFDCGIVYFILVDDKIKYIGKSKGKYFRQRMKSHFFGKGKGTKSKNDFIKKATGKVSLKFLKIKPEPLRNLVEELLIERLKTNKEWNYK